MNVIALYDIHGNIDALEAVLADPRTSGADAIVVGGDTSARSSARGSERSRPRSSSTASCTATARPAATTRCSP